MSIYCTHVSQVPSTGPGTTGNNKSLRHELMKRKVSGAKGRTIPGQIDSLVVHDGGIIKFGVQQPRDSGNDTALTAFSQLGGQHYRGRGKQKRPKHC